MLTWRRLVVVTSGLFWTLLLWLLFFETTRLQLGFEHNFWWLMADITLLSVGALCTIAAEMKAVENIKRQEREEEIEETSGGITVKCDNGKTILITKDGMQDL